MLEINLEFRIHSVLVKIGINNYEGELFDFLDNLHKYLSQHKDMFESAKVNLEDSQLDEAVFNKMSKDSPPSKKVISEDYSENCRKIASDLKLPPDKIGIVYDFGADNEVPPLLQYIKKDTRTETQRIAIILLLYANKIINNIDKISSQSLTPILIKSDIDPTASNKAFRGEYSKFVKIEGRTYRITNQGMLKARNLIKELIEKQSESL